MPEASISMYLQMYSYIKGYILYIYIYMKILLCIYVDVGLYI